MRIDRLRTLLDRLDAIRDACDLDLLVFFNRHPLALLTSEQIVAYVGYDRDRVAKSLDGLIAGGLLVRAQNPSHAARLYSLNLAGQPGGWLQSLVAYASTREGRSAVRSLLVGDQGNTPSARSATRTRLRRVV